MIILTLRTDKPDAEIGLYDDTKQLAYKTWQAHRQLAETLHTTIADLVRSNGMTVENVQGIVCYQGPGSFTGLRIGLTVANTLADALHVPIVAKQDPSWLETGIASLLLGDTDTVALPYYGADVHITPARK